MIAFLVACAEEEPAPPPVAPPPPPLPAAPACPPVPDDVVAAIAPATPASEADLGDRVLRAGPEARCAWQPGAGGRAAVVTRTGVFLVRQWPEAPAEILLTRPVPLDGEKRIAASATWRGPTLEIAWWDDLEHPCSEEIGSDLVIHWTCPDRPAPPVERPVAWPDPVDR